MEKNIEFYLKKYDGFLDSKECAEAVKEFKKQKWEQHVFYSPSLDENVNQSGDKELDVSYDLPSNHDYFMKRFWDALSKYVIEDVNFKWWNSWHGYSHIRYNRYKETRVMAEHCDHIHSMFGRNHEPTGIPVLSVLCNFNDNYEGGELIFWQDTKIRMGTGDVIIFPSNFLYPHRVEAVTKGIRYSGVSWTW
jgi:hypothetical protein